MKATIASLLLAAYTQVPTTLQECKVTLGKTIENYETIIDLNEMKLSDQITLCKITTSELEAKLAARTSTAVMALAPEPVVVQEGFDALEVTGVAIGSAVVGAAIGVLITFFLVKQ